MTVGARTSSPQRFIVSRDVLKDAAGLLKTASEQDLCVGTVDELSCVNCGDFNLYLNWLHYGTIATGVMKWIEYFTLFSLYKLSLTLQDTKFRFAVLDAIIIAFNTSKDRSKECSLPNSLIVCWVYHETEEDSMLRKIVVDMYLKRADQSIMRSQRGVLPLRFLQDMVESFIGSEVKDTNFSDDEVAVFKAGEDKREPRKRKHATEDSEDDDS